ncbi:FkbM family methyltransferase [Nocardioides sp. C4-1]|uniref:FkbM family methyltransferase n=1 Tax=Nocardioides sp. C4-1 TaxID=3151851 RepID=UPI00326713A5
MRRSDFRLDGMYFSFRAGNPGDYIQGHHLSGLVYELDELRMLVARLGPKPVILDVGANVGNHSVYLSKSIPGATIYPVEPGRDAVELLRANLRHNRCHNVDRRFIGVGFSDAPSTSVLRRVSKTNLGGSRVVTGDELAALGDQVDNPEWFEDVRLVRGDAAVGDIAPTFVKIDVEGAEMSVLRGLDAVIRRHRPEIFVEVERPNQEEFLAWLESVHYVVDLRLDPSGARSNYLVRPVTAS